MENILTMTATREGFHSVTPYLQVHGAANLIQFITATFGAEQTFQTDRPDASIRHAEVRIGNSMIELADATATFPALPTGIHVFVPDCDAGFARALAAGAAVIYAPVDRAYGDRESGVRDVFGNHWYIATHIAAGSGEYVRPGLREVTPYLHPHGAAKLIDFVERAFGASVELREMAPEGHVRHAQVRIGDSALELGETHVKWPPMAGAIHLYVSDTDSTYRRALTCGATSLMEPADQPYGDRAAGVIDEWGNYWYLASRIAGVAGAP